MASNDEILDILKRLEERVDKGFKQAHEDMSVLKGDYAWVATGRQMDLLASNMDHKVRNVLTQNEIDELYRLLDTSIPKSEQDSFRNADYIVCVVNYDEEPYHRPEYISYLAIEVSFTVDEEDIRRAARNARYVAEITKSPAYSVVAGLRKDNNATTGDGTDRPHWYQLRQDA